VSHSLGRDEQGPKARHCQRPWIHRETQESKRLYEKLREAEKLKNIERFDCNSCQVNTETLMKEGQKMKTKQNFTISLIALLAIALISTTAWAKKPPPPACPAGLTGTWVGGAGGDIHWLAAHTSDSLDPTKGEMIMNWTYIKPNFIGGVNSGVTLTPGHGVWQLNDDGDYDYTWYAYAISTDESITLIAAGDIVATIRVSGVAKLQDLENPTASNCDIAIIYYNFDMVEGEFFPWDSNTADFQTMTSGQAGEMRVPLVVTPLP
jgi:hypothetical protein